MKKIELNDETFETLQQLAAAKNLSPSELIAAMLSSGRPPLAGDNLLFFLTGAEFTGHTDPVERYLALLAWCAQNYARDFADFIAHQESGLRYLALNRDEVNELRAHNQARQIDGTQYWAVMTIDDTQKRRFVIRMLEFIGCHDETVSHASRALGLGEIPARGFHLLGV